MVKSDTFELGAQSFCLGQPAVAMNSGALNEDYRLACSHALVVKETSSRLDGVRHCHTLIQVWDNAFPNRKVSQDGARLGFEDDAF
jgi:hypothetical protein